MAESSEGLTNVGVVFRVLDDYAFIWMIDKHSDRKRAVEKFPWDVAVGHWVQFDGTGSASTVSKLDKSVMLTRSIEVSKDKIFQVQVSLTFAEKEERIERDSLLCTVANSEEFGRIGIFGPARDVIPNVEYAAVIERMPDEFVDLMQDIQIWWILSPDAALKPIDPQSKKRTAVGEPKSRVGAEAQGRSEAEATVHVTDTAARIRSDDVTAGCRTDGEQKSPGVVRGTACSDTALKAPNNFSPKKSDNEGSMGHTEEKTKRFNEEGGKENIDTIGRGPNFQVARTRAYEVQREDLSDDSSSSSSGGSREFRSYKPLRNFSDKVSRGHAAAVVGRERNAVKGIPKGSADTVSNGHAFEISKGPVDKISKTVFDDQEKGRGEASVAKLRGLSTKSPSEKENIQPFVVKMAQGSSQAVNVIPKLSEIRPEVRRRGPFVGIVVGRSVGSAHVWCPELGDGILAHGGDMELGCWIRFYVTEVAFSRSSHLKFAVRNCVEVRPVLHTTPTIKSVLLTSTIVVPKRVEELDGSVALKAEWVGEVIDRNSELRRAVLMNERLFGRVVEVLLQRENENFNSAATVWCVYKVKGEVAPPGFDTSKQSAVCEPPEEESSVVVLVDDDDDDVDDNGGGQSVGAPSSSGGFGQPHIRVSPVPANRAARGAPQHNLRPSPVNVAPDVDFARDAMRKGRSNAEESPPRAIEDDGVVVQVDRDMQMAIVWSRLGGESLCWGCADLQIGDWLHCTISTAFGRTRRGVVKWERIADRYRVGQKDGQTFMETFADMPLSFNKARDRLVVEHVGEVLDTSHIFSPNVDSFLGHRLLVELRFVGSQGNDPAWDISFIQITDTDEEGDIGGFYRATEQVEDANKPSRFVEQPHMKVQKQAEEKQWEDKGGFYRVPNAREQPSSAGRKKLIVDNKQIEQSHDFSSIRERGQLENNNASRAKSGSFNRDATSSGARSHANEFDEQMESDDEDLDMDFEAIVAAMREFMNDEQMREVIEVNCPAAFDYFCDFFGLT